MTGDCEPDLVTGGLIPTRQSLLSRLKNWDDRESWNDFFTTYWKLIFITARKSGLTQAEAEDVVQETVICVCKRIPKFKYDRRTGTFKSWLLRLTYWRIQDQFRARLPALHTPLPPPPEREGEDRTDPLEKLPDPGISALQALWDAEWEKNLFEAAMERVKKTIDPKSFQIFDLYVLQKWPVAKIAALLKVAHSTVYVAKHRIAHLVKKEMKQLDQQLL